MTAVWLTIGAAVLGYALDAVFVGALLTAWRLRSGRRVVGWRLLVGLLVVFAALDWYWIPAMVALDATLKIGNPGAAAVFGRDIGVTDMLSLAWLDVIIWAVQGLVAVWVADRLFRRQGDII